MIISVDNLKKSFNNNLVLNDISFEVKEGEVFGIVGHSGAGKSTLLRCLNGLEKYQSGSVKVLGKDVGSLDANNINLLRKDMGMIFQNFNLMSHKNVFDNIALPLDIWKIPKNQQIDRVNELLDMVGLKDKSTESIKNLSGGQKQRVGIARALALEPKILLCDEATSALDPKTTKSILDLLEDIQKALKLTIIMVTHQMEVVKRSCNRVLLLEDGITQVMGKTEELFLQLPKNLRKLIDDEYTLIPSGTNIRLWFPKNISQQPVIANMARAIDVSFSIVGGKLERYTDDVRGYLIINVNEQDMDKVTSYLKNENLYWEILENE